MTRKKRVRISTSGIKFEKIGEKIGYVHRIHHKNELQKELQCLTFRFNKSPNEIDLWRQSLKGHESISRQLTPHFSELRTDLSSCKLKFEGRASAIFSSTQDYNVISVFADGSKMKSGVEVDVFSKSAKLSISFKLSNTASVFDAEVLMNAGAREILKGFPIINLRTDQGSDNDLVSIKTLVRRSNLLGIQIKFLRSGFQDIGT